MKLAGLGGFTAFKWHGDVTSAAKRDFHQAPADILMLTPESLEVILAVPRYQEQRLFGDLRYVIIDEVHAFAGGTRGDHLVALLERLTQCTSNDFQRIALSATVQNPETLLDWLRGTSRRPSRLVRPESEPVVRTIEIHPVTSKEHVPGVVRTLARAKKSLVFADSRGGVERIRHAIADTGLDPFVHHGSLSKDLREEAEEAFRKSGAACIICTSTLELGLDIGDLELVIQIDAPSTVSSFLQRLGRTGRRPGSKGRMAFVTDADVGFLQAAALVSLARRRYIESVVPPRRSAGVYVQQVLARILQSQGMPRRALIDGVGEPYCFADLALEEREEILEHLDQMQVLRRADSLLTFGDLTEHRFSGMNYVDLYSVFEVTQELNVVTTNNRQIGTIDSWFAQNQNNKDFVFVLGGKSWTVVEADWDHDKLVVAPAQRGAIPSWLGEPKLLSRRLCEEMRGLLLADDMPTFLGGEAEQVLARLRADWRPLLEGQRPVIVTDGMSAELVTFAGGKINNVFMRLLQQWLGLAPIQSNTSVRLKGPDAADAIRRVVNLLKADPASVRTELLKGLDDSLTAKFEEFLPERLWREAVLGRLFDIEGAAELATAGVAAVQRPT